MFVTNGKLNLTFCLWFQVLRSFVQRYHSDLPSKELHSCANGIIVVLLEKLGHSNVRIRESTSEALLFLAMNKEIGLNCVAPHLLKPPKSQVGLLSCPFTSFSNVLVKREIVLNTVFIVEILNENCKMKHVRVKTKY
jgi:hypothetical protein